MKNSNGVVQDEALGAESDVKPVTIEVVRGFLKRDLSASIHMLDAIYRDQDILELLAQVMHGKYLNAKHVQELNKDLNKKP